MKSDRVLRLPHRAAQKAPSSVLTRFGGHALPGIGFSEKR
jgi:hypothetical protein